MLKNFINKLSTLIPKIIEFRDFLLLDQVKKDCNIFYKDIEVSDDIDLNKVRRQISFQIREIENIIKDIESNFSRLNSNKKKIFLKYKNLTILCKKMNGLQRYINDEEEYEEEKKIEAERKAKKNK
jgi:hypothetical protein